MSIFPRDYIIYIYHTKKLRSQLKTETLHSFWKHLTDTCEINFDYFGIINKSRNDTMDDTVYEIQIHQQVEEHFWLAK